MRPCPRDAPAMPRALVPPSTYRSSSPDMNRLLIVLFWLELSGAGLRAQSPQLTPGPFPVGFTHLTVTDSTQPTPSSGTHPLDIGIWYPSEPDTTSRLTYRDYFLLTPPPQDSIAPAEAARRELDGFAAFLASHGADPTAVTTWLGSPMLATSDARPAAGRFAVVLVAQGNEQTLHDQAPLCEYLASHGFVVASAPSPMRTSGPLTDVERGGARAQEQAVDLAMVLARVATRADADSTRVGVVGHSFGARAGLLLAMHDRRVGALVSLDGGIGTAAGRSSLEHAAWFSVGAARAPILHLYERLDPFMTPDFALLRSLGSSERWLVDAPAMHHHHFSSLGAVVTGQPALAAPLGASDRTPAAYVAVLEGTLGFLDHFLASRPQSTSWPGKSGLPAPLTAAEHLAALPGNRTVQNTRSTATPR
jgi:dienelactone hydrolase